jgi:hypothetical protein
MYAESMRAVLVFLACTGCSSILGIEDFKLGDAGGGGEMGEVGYCLGFPKFRVCLDEEPTSPLAIDEDLLLDTSASNLCANKQPTSWSMQGQPKACFLVGSSVTISAKVQARGALPLVIFASESITITSSLDAASHNASPTNMIHGPGSTNMMQQQELMCIGTAPGTGTATAGGRGGTFRTRGGDGGKSSAGSVGGQPPDPSVDPPMVLRPGCDGGSGPTSTTNMTGGSGGYGGGAVYLVAKNKITINGVVNVSGAAGGGGRATAGGGGGGSGVMIHRHAMTNTAKGGLLMGTGGGGGGGGGQSTGSYGLEPSLQTPTQVAPGGVGGTPGGNGGDGFASTPPTVSQAERGDSAAVGGPASGGGGGGGGSGYIHANVTLSGITTSPSVSTP